MKIQQFPYSHLANANLSGVCNRLSTAFDGFPKEEVRSAINSFTAKAAEFNKSIRQITASPYSQNLNEIEPERDRLINLLYKMVSDATKSRNDDLKEAGNQVNVVLRTYGKPAKMPIDQQTIITRKILRDLGAESLTNYIKLIPGLAAVVTQVEELNEVFDDLYNARTADHKEIEKGLTLRLRGELINSVRAAVEAVNAAAVLFPDYEIEYIVKSANAILDQARVNLANRNKNSTTKTEGETNE